MSTVASSSTVAKPTFAQYATKRMVHDLLIGSGLPDQAALEVVESRSARGFEQLIGHKMLEEEKRMRHFSISAVMFPQKPVQDMTKFPLFDRDVLESVLQLDPLRKHNTGPPPSMEEVKQPPAKRARPSKSNAASALPTVIVMDPTRPTPTISSSLGTTSSGKVPAPASHTVPATAATVSSTSASASSSSKIRSGLPTNFYSVVRNYFSKNYFETLKYEDFHVSNAFFAKITASNYRDFYLDNPKDGCNFITIQEKMKGQKYTGVEEFLFDFKLLFHNIIEKFPREHLAVKEAMILKEKFENEWPSIESKLVWK